MAIRLSSLAAFGVFLTFNPFPMAYSADSPPDTLLVSAPGVESPTVSELAKYGYKLEIITREKIVRGVPDADITRMLQMYVPGLYVSPKMVSSITPTNATGGPKR